MTRIKSILLTGFFFFALLTCMQAQQQYQYAVIDFCPSLGTMEVSINGIDYKKLKLEKGEVKGEGDVNMALKEINTMAKEGWELFNTNTTAGSSSTFKSFIFYLRKKIN